MANQDGGAERSLPGALLARTLAGVGILAAALAFLAPSGAMTVVRAVAVVGLAAVLLSRISGGRRRPSVGDLTDPWVLSWVGAGSLAIGTTSGSTTASAVGATALLAASLSCASVAVVVMDRVRAVAVPLLAETAIATATLGLAVWALAVEPRMPDQSTFLVSTTFLAATIALATVRVVFSLISMANVDDRASVRWLGVATCAIASLCTVELIDAFTNNAHRLIAPLAVVALATTSAGMIHPSSELLLAPAVVLGTGIDLRRVSMAVAGVLVGPALIGVGLVLDQDVSMTTIVMGGSLISLVVVLYVLRLVSSWGLMEHAVNHDPLTGLPNRTLFYERLNLAIARSRTDRRTISLLFLDLDRFKNVNDSLGHEAGNDLLRGVADRLSRSIQGDATVARLGGDEFAIILPKVKSLAQSEAIARQILARFSQPFDLGRRRLYITPSIGIAHFPQDAAEASLLIEAADAAMYRAKERGRNTVELFAGSPKARARNRVDLESALHDAINTDQLRVVYQPKLRVSTGQITSVEALIRWHHPTFGPVAPALFIPVAEECGLIDVIGEWVLFQACSQALKWDAEGLPPLGVAVNVSPRQFQLARVPDVVARVLRATDLSPRRLELELTETLALQDPAEVAQSLDQMRSIGVRFAIDDFGVGYSGLEYLERFRFDTIKIDRKFVRGIDESGGPIVKAVIAMAKGLSLEVVAEGVETPSQYEFLRGHGCDLVQGFLLSAPVPPAQITEMVHKLMAPRAVREPAAV